MSNHVDPVFEYIDAPKKVDFAQLAKEEENIDQWFGTGLRNNILFNFLR
jgi:hypothetical protein